MRFPVPQFIETEIQLIGPLTLKQFLWLASGAALTFLLIITFSNYYAIAGGFLIMVLASVLAFKKINDIPLSNFLAFALTYYLRPKKYIFMKKEEDAIKKALES